MSGEMNTNATETKKQEVTAAFPFSMLLLIQQQLDTQIKLTKQLQESVRQLQCDMQVLQRRNVNSHAPRTQSHVSISSLLLSESQSQETHVQDEESLLKFVNGADS